MAIITLTNGNEIIAQETANEIKRLIDEQDLIETTGTLKSNFIKVSMLNQDYIIQNVWINTKEICLYY